MNFLKKIQSLPKYIREIIFWVIIISLSAGLLFLWVKSTKRKLKNFQREEVIEKLNIPQLKKELKKEIKEIEEKF
ncbi:hypothetical protein J7K44_00480 [bacterium]|nr:hypothetical protein [bacterium]